jgi:hypothetical protein
MVSFSEVCYDCIPFNSELYKAVDAVNLLGWPL